MQLTHTEENYIKLVYKLSHAGQQSVSTKALADALHISPAAITDMIQRMYRKGLLIYQKYQGVNVSPMGQTYVMQILRRRRLWEVFLVKKLNFAWDEIQDIVEDLEHIQSNALIEHLDTYLEYPTYSPHGEPIPNISGEIKQEIQITLSQFSIGQKGVLFALKDDSTSFLHYLNKRCIYLGVTIEVLDHIPFDASLDVSIDGEKLINIPLKASDNLLMMSS